MFASIVLSLSLISQAKAAAAPILFNTPQADRIVAKLQIFPADNPWNQQVTKWPLHPNSRALVASIGEQKPLRYNQDMNFVLVSSDQPKVPVKLRAYPEESDKGPYPVPDNLPIEGWPGVDKWEGMTLAEYQANRTNSDADRHAIVVDAKGGKLYEFYQMQKGKDGWSAAQASIFDLKSNVLRPDGWTSTDAAGLPIFPSIIRYDEIAAGEIHHALRFTVRRSRRAYVAPATHFASRLTDLNLPRMGERFRLKASYDISKFSRETQVVLKALKTYGMLVADNGQEWAISCSPDPRIPVLHEELRRVKGSDFEVVVTPGTNK